ncbi:MAG: phycobilisome rod-core linker polypeptide [Cyanobacteria bacterium P01_G01_bin.39]
MALPLLKYPVASQNNRVDGYEVPGEEQPKIFTTENLLSETEFDELIYAAYRQVFNEQQILQSNRERELESQLKASQITVRDFMRGLVLSETFQRRNYQVNNNYRFVRLCVQRLLGRDVYNNEEKLSWSIVLATSGLKGFIDRLLDTDEYMDNFGDDIVPYQRHRILPQREQGEMHFARMARYGTMHRQVLLEMGYFFPRRQSIEDTAFDWQKTPGGAILRPIGAFIAIFGALFLVSLIIYIALGAWGIIRI